MSEPESSRTVYDGKLFDVVVERWGEREREIVEHPGSTAIVAIDRDGFVVLVRQTREPARTRLLELPAGTLEPGEEPIQTARRELDEEVGLRGGRWRELGDFFTTPGFCRERMYVFLAEDVQDGEPSPDEGEDLEVVRWRVEEIESRLSELEDAKTIAGLLLYLQHRNRT
jgi:ADP-ribose pyrophosphatase